MGGPEYLAAGMQDDDPALWISRDGVHWQRAASAAAFPGSLTTLLGVAARGSAVVVVGRYGAAAPGQFGVRLSSPISSAWVWMPRSSALAPTPVPHTGTIDPKLFRLRLADLPTGYIERDFGGWPDFCDDGNTLCRSINRAVGPYGAYETSFVSTGGSQPMTDIESMAIEGTRSNAHALASLGQRLVRWWNRGALKQVLAPVHIGQETLVYHGTPPATSSPPGGHIVSYAVEWRDGKAIGQVYVEQPPQVPARTIEMLAIDLARVQWQHLRTVKAAEDQISPPSLMTRSHGRHQRAGSLSMP